MTTAEIVVLRAAAIAAVAKHAALVAALSDLARVLDAARDAK